MRTLSTSIWTAFQKLIDDGLAVWLITIEIDPGPPPEAFHLCSNNEALTLDERTYMPWPIAVAEIPEAGRGDLEECSITLANIHRMTGPYLETGTSLAAPPWDQCRVEMILAYKSNGGSVQATGIEFTFRIQATTETDDKVTLSLGQPNFLQTAFPWERYIRGDKYPAMPRNQ